MGRVSGNDGRDPNTIEMFPLVEPPVNDGVVELTFKSSKQDGYPVWTANKAKLIQRYVRYFLYITKHGTYIDGFAGPQVEAYNDDSWSAKRVLEIQPDWLRRFILCDKSASQVAHLEKLKADREAAGDKRKIEIHQGDFNKVIDSILSAGNIKQTEATFCLLDQRTFECEWETVKKIAAYQKEEMKIEQFYFLAVGWLNRSMTALKGDKTKLRKWWGRDDIEVPQSAKTVVDLARLFSHRFIRELGYATAAAWPIYERDDQSLGKIMYFMIHATDHPEAPKLMNRAYRAATLALEPMEHLQAQFEAAGFELPAAKDQ
jgi:three-Cys-motif partner protein